MVAWTLVAHIFGFFLWVAGLLTAAIVQERRSKELSSESSYSLARLEKMFLRGMADPGALIAIVAGITLISTNAPYYLHARWLHIKLTFVATLLLLHVVIAIRSRAGRSPGSVPPRYGLLLAGAVVLVFILILMATLPGEVFLT